MPSNHLILCCPLLLLPSIFPNLRAFSNESALLIRWPEYWSFSVNISPSNECSGLISFRMDWLDLFEVQETLQSLLQHHNSKVSILWRSVQLSHPYITAGKTIALTRRTFVGKVHQLKSTYKNISGLPGTGRILLEPQPPVKLLVGSTSRGRGPASANEGDGLQSQSCSVLYPLSPEAATGQHAKKLGT